MAVAVVARLLIGWIVTVILVAVVTEHVWVLVPGAFCAVLFVSSCQGMAQARSSGAGSGRSRKRR